MARSQGRVRTLSRFLVRNVLFSVLKCRFDFCSKMLRLGPASSTDYAEDMILLLPGYDNFRCIASGILPNSALDGKHGLFLTCMSGESREIGCKSRIATCSHAGKRFRWKLAIVIFHRKCETTIISACRQAIIYHFIMFDSVYIDIHWYGC